MDTEDARNLLKTVALKRGRGSGISNLQAVLDVLWKIAIRFGVGRSVFEAQLPRLKRHFELLQEHGCIRLVYPKDDKKRIVLIELVRKTIPLSEIKAEPLQGVSIKSKPSSQISEVAGKPFISSNNTRESRCFMFVDIPNICYGDSHKTDQDSRYFHWTRANWMELNKIAGELSGVPSEQRSYYAYAIVPEGQEKAFRPTSDKLKNSGFKLQTRSRKDIDGFMIADIALDIPPRIQKGLDVCLIIVTGDSDFIYTLKRLKRKAKECGASLMIYCLTWTTKVSWDMRRHAQILPLEKYLQRIDPSGYEMFRADNPEKVLV